MSKCDCWHKYPASAGLEYYTGRCYGTKEREYCKCNGDASKCDFYPEKRKENKTMKTLEMMNAAKENGKTYFNESNDIIYSKELGFIDSISSEAMTICEFDSTFTFNQFMFFNWTEVNTMTRSEAEEKYGIKIIG